MDLSSLSAEERAQLSDLLAKANQGSEERARGLPPPVPEDRAWGEAPPPNPPTVTRVMDPDAWVNKQIGTLEAVGESNYRTGITMPKKDPIRAAIAGQAAYEAAMRKPEVLARRKEALEKTNMEEWAAMAEGIGARRLVEGVTARRYKVERFVGSYVPKLKSHLSTIDALPNVTDADREKRMIENVRGLKKLKGQMK